MFDGKRSDTCEISAEYSAGNKLIQVKDSVDRSEFDRLDKGDQITVYSLALNPAFMPHLKQHAEPSEWVFGGLLFQTLFVLAWCTGTFLAMWTVLSQPIRSKALVRSGVPVIGNLNSIVEKTGNRGSKKYVAQYEYELRHTNPKTGRPEIKKRQAKMNVSKDVFIANKSEVPKLLTVLYDANNPKRSIAYEICAHMAVLH